MAAMVSNCAIPKKSQLVGKKSTLEDTTDTARMVWKWVSRPEKWCVFVDGKCVVNHGL